MLEDIAESFADVNTLCCALPSVRMVYKFSFLSCHKSMEMDFNNELHMLRTLCSHTTHKFPCHNTVINSRVCRHLEGACNLHPTTSHKNL